MKKLSMEKKKALVIPCDAGYGKTTLCYHNGYLTLIAIYTNFLSTVKMH